MSASKYIKSQGLPDLQYVADKVGRHRDTINNYYNNDFEFLEILVAGVLAKDTEASIMKGIKAALKDCGYEKKSGVHRLGDDDVF